jgi:hypothetical protein
MAEPAAEGVTHIAKGAEDVEARGTDEISARLRSFDLRRHRTRERTLTTGVVAACLLTALVLLGAFYASTHRSSPAVQPVMDSSDAVGAVAANSQAGAHAAGALAFPRRLLRLAPDAAPFSHDSARAVERAARGPRSCHSA